MIERNLARTIESVATSDGAGVRLRRSLGAIRGLNMDPFLMLDEFSSDHPDDYIAGFPKHPHRGFETVTYMIDGHMRHEDHLGNRGDLGPGGVQWMTAGRGIIHSEMPQQEHGRLRGFQLWINLPAAEKMKPAAYRDIPAADVTEIELPGRGLVRVIAGGHEIDGRQAAGPINADRSMATDPSYLDVALPADAAVRIPLPAGHTACVYVFQGDLHVGNPGQRLNTHSAGVLSDGDSVLLSARSAGCRALVLAGRPLNEPVVQYGPFVMNTREQVEQAMLDYRDGRLTATR
ncbi:MAG TPA: pirin family protein [Wenzhouxiangellaceae bacterium]|nr:pirin family protein [Wenzhouxiangellaceae bacterium]